MGRAMCLIGGGILPLFLGFLLNWTMLAFPVTGFITLLLALLFLLMWGYLSFQLSASAKSPVLQAFLMCAFGLLMLALVLYQELVMGRYWSGLAGFGPQMFFLPWISLASLVVRPFMSVVRMWPIYIVIWIGLFITSCIGCKMKQAK